MKSKKKVFAKIVRSIAWISDLHVGSRYAVCPDKFQTAQKQWLIPSAGQVSLNNSLKAFGEKCDEFGVDTIVVDGDAIEGQNEQEHGVGVSTTDLDEQVAMAVEVLAPLVVPAKRQLLMLSGSGYHKSVRGMNPEKAVCESAKLKGTWLGPLANLQFGPSKRLFNVHHGYTGSVVYREMVLAREGLFSKWAEGSGKLPRFDVLVRGHLHNFIHIHEQDMHLLQLPCWKAFDPNKITLKLYAKMQPDIGGVIIRLDSDDRVIIWHYIYPSPNISGEVRVV